MIDLWVIYDHPSDYPNHFVVRRQRVNADSTISLDSHCFLTVTIAEARSHIPSGLTRVPRSAEDSPVIVETWL